MTIYWHRHPDFTWHPGIAYDALSDHVRTCHKPSHGAYVMGVYDQYGMRFNRTATVWCSSDPDGDLTDDGALDAAAREQVPQWPGQQVCLWLDLNLVPTEHLRDMPTPDAHAGAALRRSA